MANKIITTFKELGFKLQKFKENVYIFNYQGVNLVYRQYLDDDNFLQIGMPLDKCNTTTDIYMLANEINMRLKYVKSCIYDDNLWIIYERRLDEGDNLAEIIKDIVTRMVDSMHFYLDLTNRSTSVPGVVN